MSTYASASQTPSSADGPARPDRQAPRAEGEWSAQETDEAARAVMHPELSDPEWRYYHGAWGG